MDFVKGLTYAEKCFKEVEKDQPRRISNLYGNIVFHEQSQKNSYWAKSDFVKNLGTHLSRNRFLLILRMLYFQIETAGYNIFTKVEPLIHYFNNLMKTSIYPGKELSIDESMVLFRRRLLFDTPIRVY